MKYIHRFSARTARPRPHEFSEMLSWPAADLQRVETLSRGFVGQGVQRSEASRRAAEQVRRERQQRRNVW